MDRLRKALLSLNKELINAQLQNKCSRDVDSKIAKRQYGYYIIRWNYCGEPKNDGKDKLIEKFRQHTEGLKTPEVVRKVFDEELEPASNVTINHFDWLTQVLGIFLHISMTQCLYHFLDSLAPTHS